MNEQLQAALAELITKANSGLDTSVGFLSAQLPDVILQLLHWKLVEYCIRIGGITLILTLCITYLVLFCKGRKKGRQGLANMFHDGTNNNPTTDFIWITVTMTWMGILFFSLCLYTTIMGLAQLYVVPKIFLIEYAAQLTGK